VKHNQHNIEFKFQRDPVEFNKWTDKPLLQYCLGGTLYMPATRSMVDKLLARGLPALKSMVMCFEDAIRAEDVERAEDNVLEHLSRLSAAINEGQIAHDDIPLTFLRVRNPEQFRRFAGRLAEAQANVLSGFVFPKFSSSNATEYLDELQSVAERLSTLLYGMPILEGRSIGYRETRAEELQKLKEILDPYRDHILNIRVGGTDFSSLFGVRRGISSSIYDILPVRDALSDILNFFNRMEDGYTVSGPVWEYFLAHKQDDLQELLQQNLHRSLLTREPILNEAIDGLLREVVIDKANGFVGKTVIHPSHLRYVNAMQAVTLEEYEDALQILEAGDGVIKSGNANKMNEANPHRNWARRITLRAQAFGVIKNENEYIRLFMDDGNRPVRPPAAALGR
jgi:citrate lyase beta subunit